MIGFLRVVARAAFIALIVLSVAAGAALALTLGYFERDLPDLTEIANYVPAVGSKIYDANGALMTEFEREHRIPVKFDHIPPLVIHAFLAAEDRDFYKHGGVNPVAMLRAAATDLLRLPSGQRPIGASTITQQVVRHFLLSNEVSITRKIKEALLAYRIERTLSKDRILEIYLNEIYLGQGAYGVAAAADTYFHKPLDKLSLAEAASLAALPKSPTNYNPARHPHAAKARRDWVLAGMAEVGWIDQAQAKEAMAAPLGVAPQAAPADPASAEAMGYFLEEVRRELVARFGDKTVYEGGLSVHTSYRPDYQKMAEAAFRDGLVAYDRRHGWRGPLARYPDAAAARRALAGMAAPPAPAGWQPAAVTATGREQATIALKDGGAGHIPLRDLRWARRTEKDQRLGPAVRRVSDVLHPGDIVLVEKQPAKGHHHSAAASYELLQIPDASGGVVVEDPDTGRVFALVGGWSFRQSQFDRAIQAMRQPGSSFKPFVYVTALENGFTPDSMVEDEPVSIPQGPGLPDWQPANYESGYVGATTLSDALVHSRNLATVHVALALGLPAIAQTVEAFGVMDKMPPYYSMVLGAGATTLTRMTTAYAMIDNGGHWLMSSLIDTVQDRNGHILYQKGTPGCAACFVAAGPHAGSDKSSLYRPAGPAEASMRSLPEAGFADGATEYRPHKPDPLVTPTADWQLVQMMEGVVKRGTGIAVASVGKPLAGKTGTTSDWVDAWFIGFSPGLVAGVYVGFDDPRTLGHGEQGGHVAAPIFRDFMSAALRNKPVKDFAPPPGAEPVVASSDASSSDDADMAGAWSDANGAADSGYYDPGTDPGNYPDAAADSGAPYPGDAAGNGLRQVAPGFYTTAPGGVGADRGSRVAREVAPPEYPAPYRLPDGGPGNRYAWRGYDPRGAQPSYPQSWGPEGGEMRYPPYPDAAPRGPAPPGSARPDRGTGGLY
ncbi:MAG TPA: PBP1A family penicillin-binding protein [Stellaceae bacterium]|nr:PBP1A family penicillin-binding protein [Stellaceae bacterium]